MAEPMIQITHARSLRWWLRELARAVGITVVLGLFLAAAYTAADL